MSAGALATVLREQLGASMPTPQAIAERHGWTALALHEGHSLVAFLAASGELAADETGPIDLKHDEFTTGVVAGAAEVYREVVPRLRESPPPES